MIKNIIQQSILSKYERLLASIKEAEAITHPTECGSLYEAYIRKFLEDCTPQHCELYSGFVTDAKGTEVSPQLDLIGIDPRSLPITKLDSRSVICPVESLRFFIEVKATIKSTALSQVQKSLKSIQRMNFHSMNQQQTISWKPTINCPVFLVGYKSDTSKDKLIKWVDENEDIWCIVVVGEYAIWKSSGSKNIEIINQKEGDNELLFLASKLHDWFNVYTNAITKVWHLEVVAKMLQLDVTNQQQLNAQLAQTGFSMQAYLEPDKLS